MKEEDFIDVRNQGWWLIDTRLDNINLEKLRRELGERWGWDDPVGGPINEQWFTKEDNVKLVFRSLENTELMRQLDEMQAAESAEGAAVDVSKRQTWLEQVVRAKEPVERPSAKTSESPQTKAGQQPPVAPPAPPAQKEKVRLFGAKTEAAEASKPAQPAGAPKPGLFDKAKATKAAGPAQAPQAAAEAAAAPVPEAPPAPPSAAEIMALGENPEVPISKAEVEELLKDPEFESKLAAAMEKLEAELATAESEE